MKIRAHLAVQSIALLAPILLLAGYAILTLLNAERTAQLRSIREAAHATSVSSDREWSYSRGSLEALKTSVLLDRGNLAGLYAQLQIANPEKDRYTALLDATGQQQFNTVMPLGTPIGLPTPSSSARVASILKSNAAQVSNVVEGRATGRYVVAFEMPVTTSSGKQYVLSQWIYARQFARVFPRKGVPPEWLFAIFDREGRTIVRSKGPEQFEGKLPRDDLLKAILRGESDYIRNTSRDGIKLYTVLERSPTSGWTVAVGVPEEIIESAARRTVFLIAFGLVATLVIGIGSAVFFGRRLVKAIGLAERSAVLLSVQEIPVLARSHVDEIDSLQRNLHQVGMALHEFEGERAALMKLANDAQHKAELQNQAKDDFLAMLGHELRNPLSAINAGIALMNAPGVGATQASRAREAIRRQSGLLTRIVDELLDASRVMHGKVSLAKKPLDLGAAVKACFDSLELRGVTTRHRVALDTVAVMVEADPTRLDQIINNLLDNAFKYTPEGGTINVSVKERDGNAQLTIIDSGVGIDSELMPRLFDVFVQGPASLDRAKGGLGIGLSLVRAMVLQHGGTVTAESSGAGRGSTFVVRLPLATSINPTTSVLPTVVATRAGPILVIDDNDDARDMLCEMLTLSGYAVVQAATGTEGIALAGNGPLLTAIVDIGLPDVSGYDVAMQLRSDPHTAHMHLIALTGYGQQSDRDRAREAGFDAHMTKPVDFEALFKILGSIV